MASVTSDVSTSTLTLNRGPRAGVPDLWIHSHRREETDNKHVLLVLLLASPVYYVCLSFSKVKILLWFFKPRWLGGFWLSDWLILIDWNTVDHIHLHIYLFVLVKHRGPHLFVFLFIYLLTETKLTPLFMYLFI